MKAVGNFIAFFDVFSRPTSGTFNRRDRYGVRYLGNLCTLLVVIILVVHLIILIVEPIELETSKKVTVGDNSCNTTGGTRRNLDIDGGTPTGISMTLGDVNWFYDLTFEHREVVRDMFTDNTTYYPFASGYYNFCMRILQRGMGTDLSFDAYQMVFPGDNYWVNKNLVSNPTTAMFDPSLSAELTQLGIQNYYCFDRNTSIGVNGNLQTLSYQTLYLSITECTVSGCTPPNNADVENLDVQYLYIDQVFDPTDPDNPIKSKINLDVRLGMDVFDEMLVTLALRPNVVQFWNGTKVTFFSHRLLSNRLNYYGSSRFTAVTIVTDDVYDRYTYYFDQQPDFSARRALGSVTEEKTIKSYNIAFRIIDILSRLGGMYTFLILAIGFLMKPVVYKCFIHDAVNAAHLANKKEIAKIKKIERNRLGMNQMAPTPSNDARVVPGPNIEQSFQEDEPFIENEEAKNTKSPTRSKTIKPESQKENYASNKYKSEDPDAMKRGRSKEKKKGYAPVPTDMNIKRSKSAKAKESDATSFENVKLYTTSDLLYNIFCCIKLKSKRKDGRSLYERNLQFTRDEHLFNADRDIVGIVTKINMLEFKLNSIEEMLEQLDAQDVTPEAHNEEAPHKVKTIKGELPVEDPVKKQQNMSMSQVLEEAQANAGHKKYIKSIHNIISKELDQLKDEVSIANDIKNKSDIDWNTAGLKK